MDNTFEQFQVVAKPVRKADNFWVCECRYITNDLKNSIDPEDYSVGDTARFISNYMPELHEEGEFTLLSSAQSLTREYKCKIKKIFLIVGTSERNIRQSTAKFVRLLTQ